MPSLFPHEMYGGQCLRVSFAVCVLTLLLLTQSALLATPAHGQSKETTVPRLGIKIEYPVSERSMNVAWQAPGISGFTSPSEDLIGVITRNSALDDERIAVRIQYIAESNGGHLYDTSFAEECDWYAALRRRTILEIRPPYATVTRLSDPSLAGQRVPVS